jgi:SAM-dependent methyltransferase
VLTVDLDRLGVGPGDWVLDAGCGGGRHCFGAAERGANVVWLDLDVEGLRIALGGGVLRGDVFRLPFPDHTFDRVICAEVMEHVHGYPETLQELARVLRPGGTMAVTIPTATTEHLYLRLSNEYFESPGGHIRIFQPRVLARAMARAGLRVEGISFAHALHSPYWAIRCILGLNDERPALTRAYRRFLIRANQSPFWQRVEGLLDYVWPKSLVLYGTRVAGGRP